MENTTDFFAHTLSFQKKKNKRTETEYKRQFTIISIKKQLFSFLDTSNKKRTIKKRNRVYKKNPKMRVKQNEKPFFKRQKNKTWKNTEV